MSSKITSGLKSRGSLMRFRGVVLLEYYEKASAFEEDFDQMGAVPVVINN